MLVNDKAAIDMQHIPALVHKEAAKHTVALNDKIKILEDILFNKKNRGSGSRTTSTTA